MTTELHQQLAAFLDRYFEAWNRYDVAAMRAMWDEREQQTIYVAEESEPHYGWEQILGYWGIDRSASERLVSWHELTAVSASEDVAIAFIQANWSTYIPGNRLYPKPFGGPVRITMVLRRIEGDWLAIHYIEAPMASIVQLRCAHEDAVEPALHERLAAKGMTY